MTSTSSEWFVVVDKEEGNGKQQQGATVKHVDPAAPKQESKREISTLTPLNVDLFRQIFEGKSTQKLSEWCAKLQDQEFEVLGELKELNADDWKDTGLPLAVTKKLSAVAAEAGVPSTGPKETAEQNLTEKSTPVVTEQGTDDGAPAKASQLDMIVLDVSGSMKTRSNIDALKTREGVSKLMFHSMVDQLLQLELDHAVGLVAFGAKIDLVDVTLEYENFHTELGRLDARQNRTKLFDAIDQAATWLLEYRQQHSDNVQPGAKLRIFVLTDGEDNGSTLPAWQVVQRLHKLGIVLDAFPMGPRNPRLEAMTQLTGGICVDVTSEEQGAAVFTREPMLHLASRDPSDSLDSVFCSEDLDKRTRQCAANGAVVTEVSAVSSALKNVIAAKATSVDPKKVGELKARKTASGAAVKRVMKELTDTTQASHAVSVVDDDVMNWKVVIDGPRASPYAGGRWVLSVSFPDDYPFKPPRVVFLSPIFHCNVSSGGGLCLDILKSSWSPALTIPKVLMSIGSLLESPNPDDPMDAYKGNLMRTDQEEYMRQAREHTAANAMKSLEQLGRDYNIPVTSMSPTTCRSPPK